MLVKVLHEVELEERLMRVADRVKELAQEGSAEEELFAGAPDEYLDPIMSHLMTDPVKLPHSGQVKSIPPSTIFPKANVTSK